MFQYPQLLCNNNYYPRLSLLSYSVTANGIQTKPPASVLPIFSFQYYCCSQEMTTLCQFSVLCMCGSFKLSYQSLYN